MALYAANDTGIFTIDTDTGEPTLLAELRNIKDFCVDTENELLYVAAGQGLYTVATDTGELTELGGFDAKVLGIDYLIYVPPPPE